MSNCVVSGKVIAGCYEEDPALMNQDQYYLFRLAEMVMPEERIVIREYCGNLEQIGELLAEMDKDEWCQYFYSSTLRAWDKFRSGDLGAVHRVENGKLERLLTPVSEMARACFLVDGVEWQYRDKYDCLLRARAECAEITQVLLQDGDRYIRCCKYWLQGLQRVHGEKGWIPYDNAPQGLEHLFVHRHSDTVFSRLFLPEWEGTDKSLGMYEVQDEFSLRLGQLSRELLSNY